MTDEPIGSENLRGDMNEVLSDLMSAGARSEHEDAQAAAFALLALVLDMFLKMEQSMQQSADILDTIDSRLVQLELHAERAERDRAAR